MTDQVNALPQFPLTTQRAVAITGILFSLLLITSLALIPLD